MNGWTDRQAHIHIHGHTYIEDITFVSLTDDVYDMSALARET